MHAFDLTEQSLHELTQRSRPPCVSLYIPLGPPGPARDEARIRLKNQLARAEKLLEQRDAAARTSDALLRPVRNMLTTGLPAAGDVTTLAIFSASDLFESLTFNGPAPELTIIGEQFFIKPLISVINENHRFRLLVLSQNHVQLFEGDRHTMQPVEVPNLPRNLDEALQDDDASKPLQFHTGAADGGGERPAIFHGHAVGKEDVKERVLRFCQLLSNAVDGHFRHQDTPLILAGAEPLLSLYRDTSSYNNLFPDSLPGDPGQRTDAELHAQAWNLITPQTTRNRDAALEHVRAGIAKEHGTTAISAAVPAAFAGRVETLLVTPEETEWGTLDPQALTVAPVDDAAASAEELTNLATIQTLRNGGRVFALAREHMPDRAPLAAAYRY